MHGEIEIAGRELLLELFREKSFAADLGQRTVGNAVALGRQNDDFEHFLRQIVSRHKPVAGFVCLRERQRAAPRADPERFCLHPL